MTKTQQAIEAERQVRLTLRAFNVWDEHHRISEAIVKDLDWYLKFGEVS